MNSVLPMQPPSEKAAWRQVLGVTPQATEDEIRQAYRNLVHVWHPDRFVAPHLKALAEEKLKEINTAYESLDAARGSEFDQPSDPNSSGTPPPEPAVLPKRALSKWMPLAVTLATVLIIAGFFYLVGRNGSRAPSKQVQTSAVDNIPPPHEVRPAVPKPRKASQPAEAPTQPETGLLEEAQPPFGAGRLTVSNDTDLDVYTRLILKTKTPKQLLAIYIRSGESFSVTRLAVGEYMLYEDAGRGWLPTARTFATDRQQLDPVGPLTYWQLQTAAGVQSDEYTVALSAQAPKTVFRFPSFR